MIPSKAYAKLSTRLVPNQDPGKIAKLVERHIRKLLPKTVTCKFEVLSTGKPWVAPYSHPIFQKAIHALEAGFGKKAVFIREGGSIPFVTQMHDTFKVPCVLLGFGLPDENAHAPDEHIALENYFGGIKAVALFYEQLGGAVELGRSRAREEMPDFIGLFLMFSLAFARQDGYSSRRHPGQPGPISNYNLRRKREFDGNSA